MLKKVSEVLDINSQELKEAILKDHDTTLDNYLKLEGASEMMPNSVKRTSEVTAVL